MASQEPNLGLSFGWSLGESGWNLQMDENLKAVGALLLLSVKSATQNSPPAVPVAGDRYLVPSSGATGVWAGHEGAVARYSGTSWEIFNAKDGWEVTAQDSKQRYHFNGTAWALWASRLSSYANDAAAAAGGVPVGGLYTNSSTGALHVRLS